MNFEQAKDGIQHGQEARRSSWTDRLSFVRLANHRLMQFRSDSGWKHWVATVDDLKAVDWILSQPSWTHDAR